MIAILWSLFGACAYGVSDFIGGVTARRSSPWPVAFMSSVGAVAAAAVLTVLSSGAPTPDELSWGAFAGIGGGVGTAFLYRGLAAGRIGVVAPISAVCAAALPVVASTLTGERPPVLSWIGIASALPGIWMVSLEEGSWAGGEGVADGFLAGLGFGVSFVGLGHVHRASGWSPLVAMAAVSAATIYVMARLAGERAISREPVVLWGLAGGLLATGAMAGFILATSRGLVSIAAVLVSLYPAFTIVLAVTVLHERIRPVQRLGLAVCAVAVVLVAMSGQG